MKNMIGVLAILISTSILPMESPSLFSSEGLCKLGAAACVTGVLLSKSIAPTESPSLFSSEGLSKLGTACVVGVLSGAAGSRLLPNNAEWKANAIISAKFLAGAGLVANINGELHSESPFDNPLNLAKMAIFIIGFSVGRLASDALVSVGEK